MTCLFEKWSVKGHWWSSDQTYSQGAALRVSGELFYEPFHTGVSLSVMGAAHDLRHPAGLDSFNFTDDWPQELWVHGIDISGKPITLAGVALGARRYNTASHLANQTEILARYLLCGIHATPDSTFCEATVSFPGLAAFLEFAFKTQNATPGTAIRHRFTVSASFGDQPLTLSFWQDAHYGAWSASSAKPDPAPVSGITIEPLNRQGLDWYFEVIYSLQYFLSVLYGLPTCPDRITLGKDVSVYYRFNRQNISQSPTWTEMIVRCLGDFTFREALRTWLSYGEAYREATYRFFSSFFFPHQKANVDLVFYSQTLEILHELISPSKGRLSDQQKAAFKGIKKWIRKASNDKALTNEIINKLQWVGNPSQRERLTELFQEIHAYVPGLFYANPAAFVEAVVLTRNFYIHGTKKKVFLSLLQQSVAVRGLELAIVLLLLKNLGFPGQFVNHGLIKTELWRRWALFKDNYLPF